MKNIEHVHARVVGKMEFWPNLRSTTSATEMREKEHKEFTATKAALEQGMANLRKAIDVHPSIAESPFAVSASSDAVLLVYRGGHFVN